MYLVARLAEKIPSIGNFGRGPVRLGIGDDSAVLRPSDQSEFVVSCDFSLEGVHFCDAIHPAVSIGYRCLARATSDIAAMGARPRYFLLALAMPREKASPVPKRSNWLDSFASGLGRAARELGLVLIGGDITVSPSITICITVIGELPSGHAISRSSARPGDLIYVTGTLGAAQLGLELLLSEFGDPASRPPQSARLASPAGSASKRMSSRGASAPGWQPTSFKRRRLSTLPALSRCEGQPRRKARKSERPVDLGLQSGARIAAEARFSSHHADSSALHLRRGPNRGGRASELQALIQPHLYPQIPIAFAQALARRRIPSAMMDISDGLSTDLTRLCQSSRTGARLLAAQLPRVSLSESALRKFQNAIANRDPHPVRPEERHTTIHCHPERSEGSAFRLPGRKSQSSTDAGPLPLNSLQLALHGGEDYALLFTIPPNRAPLLRSIAAKTKTRVTHIGEITRSRKILLIDSSGRASTLDPRGWNPFRTDKASALSVSAGSSVPRNQQRSSSF